MFDFTVVIPVYNAADFLQDALDSIEAQTVGMRCIEVIIVDDGSTDDSSRIYNAFAEKYPYNVTCIRQENHGVSAARNAGLNKSRNSRFVNFLDADDMWSPDAFEKAKTILDSNPDIDLVSCMMEYTGAKTGLSHPLNRKFQPGGSMIVDLLKNPDMIQMHIASCFIRRNALVCRKFTDGMKYAEDARLLVSVMMYKHRYGTLGNTSYLYRKREDQSSAVDRCQTDPQFYIRTLQDFHMDAIRECMERQEYVPLYVQHMLAYDLQWRVKRPAPENILTEEEKTRYISIIQKILQHIDDKIILAQKNIWGEHKILCLSLKHGQDITENLIQSKHLLYYHGNCVASASSRTMLKITSMKIEHKVFDILHVEALINTPIKPGNYQFAVFNGTHCLAHMPVTEDCKKHEKVCLSGHYYYEKWTQAFIILDNKKTNRVSFCFSYKSSGFVEIAPGFTDTCRMNTTAKNGFLVTGGYMIRQKGNSLVIQKTDGTSILTELGYDLSLLRKRTWKIPFYRLAACMLKKIRKKDIWIVSDREDAAGDNGEAFFRYLTEHDHGKHNVWFALSKASPDWNRIKKEGKVVDANSIRYKLLFLLASKVISSQANDITMNPFGKGKKFVKDLYQFDFAFLQHGIIKDDLSGWLNKADKDISFFLTSSRAEYQSVVNGSYGYHEQVVRLTGMPRHDLLQKNTPKTRKVAIVPTWRKGITECFDKEGNPVYNPDFKETAFFRFYDSLIHNRHLAEEMERLGYHGIFILHPMFSPQTSHFSGTGRIQVADRIESYQKLFEEYDMLVTDYSSIFFDFGYLGKPVVYAQFDREEFFRQHSYTKGYFDYEKDGFGPVCTDEYSTVKEIIRLMENGCDTEEKYHKKEKNFFPELGCHSENIYMILDQG